MLFAEVRFAPSVVEFNVSFSGLNASAGKEKAEFSTIDHSQCFLFLLVLMIGCVI